MRNPNRIPILLDVYQRETVKESYLKNVVGLASKADVTRFLNKWNLKESQGEVEKVWKENPDFRMSQVLIAAKVLPNFAGSWFNTEDEKFMKQYGIADERLTTVWNKKDGDLKERGIPLKSISDRDLFLLKQEVGEENFPVYLEKEIEYRKGNGIKVTETNNPYYSLDID
jgi:hypothetical protein